MSERATVESDEQIAWTPGEDYIERSRLRRFMESNGNTTIEEHLAWAAADIGRYWDAVNRDLGLRWHRRYEQVLDLSNGAPWAEWFKGGGFNYVANCVDRQ